MLYAEKEYAISVYLAFSFLSYCWLIENGAKFKKKLTFYLISIKRLLKANKIHQKRKKIKLKLSK
jgi:hypothetical protein